MFFCYIYNTKTLIPFLVLIIKFLKLYREKKQKIEKKKEEEKNSEFDWI